MQDLLIVFIGEILTVSEAVVKSEPTLSEAVVKSDPGLSEAEEELF